MTMLLTATGCGSSSAEAGAPRPDHIVVVIEENQPYDAVIGDTDAPYLNQLARQGASLTQFYALTHPSQPNYLALFAGSFLQVTDDSCPHALTSRNLGSELREAGLTFVGYAQSMPRVGFTGCSDGAYVRKHNPWVNFGNLPASVNRPWTDFPRDFTDLPTVSFVVPDLQHDMHDTRDGSVRKADAWLRNSLGEYADWAMTHNSMLVVTWDEDASGGPNHVPTIVVGEHVRRGDNAEPNNQFGLLRMILDAYGLDPLHRSGDVEPVDVWGDG